jgi:hypothetical protein
VNLIIKKMPGLRAIDEFRCLFVDSPGARPSFERRITGGELREFLTTKLGEDPAIVGRCLGQLSTELSGVSFIEGLRLDSGEIKILLRGIEAEEAAAAAEAAAK